MASDTRPTRQHAVLTGWGRAGGTAADLVDVDDAHLAAAIKELPARGGIARGLGRSYGDPAQNAGGQVLRLAAAPERISIDERAGTATVGAGTSIDDLLDLLVPRGWFVPVTPGTRFVTIGGAIASDIHGKNHHADGSFGDHVLGLRLMLADTTVVDIGPGRDPEMFWATVGGMGLTGVIVDATIRLIPIATSRMSVETRRVDDLDEIMSRMSATDADVRYSVAWIDLLARGAHLGRGVLTNAEHATADRLAPADAADPLGWHALHLASVPPLVPPRGVINRFTVAAFNEMWFRRAPRHRAAELQSIPAYFHPLDLVGDWNRVYGRAGFVQYQFVVPFGAEGTLRTIVERISAARLPIFLTVLKRLRRGNPGMLSFPMGGWTLTIDVGAAVDGLGPLLRGFDELVLAAGGRHYLAKDFHMTTETLRAGYPRLDEFLAVRERVDPAGTWVSDQARRLGLVPDGPKPEPG